MPAKVFSDQKYKIYEKSVRHTNQSSTVSQSNTSIPYSVHEELFP